MDFFESQDRARRKTGHLIFLFLLATFGLILITNFFLLGMGVMFTAQEGQLPAAASWKTHAMVSAAVLAVIGIASLYKIAVLSGGGEVVAQSLGGRLLNTNTNDRYERRVLNVVEEMAIAAGLPVPPVYVLDDDALNAFAAGFNSDDAVIGITRGCMRMLNREELQGVVAHEFSHILHGDMRINIRLIGVLFGILVIGNIGYYMMRSASYQSRSSNSRDGAMPLIAIGIGMVVIGYIGTFFGNLIKASVSRQREFLADASAVQYTRNPEGIGNALRKIGGFRFGSRILAPNAAEASHLFIGQVLKLSSFMATHPPIEDRISRLIPSWDGSFIDTEAVFRENQREKHFNANASSAGVSQLDSAALRPDIDYPGNAGETVAAAAAVAGTGKSAKQESVLDSVGDIKQPHLDYAREMLDDLRGEILAAVHSPKGARAAVYCVLLSNDELLREQQLAEIRISEDAEQAELVEYLLPSIQALGVEYRLPIVDLCLPSLKRQYIDQHRDFRECLLSLMRADNNIDLFEWCLHRLFVRHLDAAHKKPRRSRVRFKSVQEISVQCCTIIAALASQAGVSNEVGEQAYAEAMQELGFANAKPYSGQPSLKEIDIALADACALAPLEKPRLVKACARSVLADGEVHPEEYELLRVIADSMDVPLPPRLAQQSLV